MIAQVGTISANNDETIGKIIAEAMKKVGKDGVITVEESKTLETQLEVVEGMQFDRGYLSPYFVTDPERMEAALENAYILIHEKKISSMKDLLPLLEQIAKSGKPLLHHRRRRRRRSAGHPGRQQAAWHAASRGRQGARLRRSPQSHAAGHRHPHRRQGHHRRPGHQAGERADQDLGQAKKITIDKDNTTIVEGKGKHGEIEGRVKEIRSQIDKTTSDYDREKLQERLAKLVGGVAVIKVGAATETEMKEKKARVEDAMHATRAAVEEGIVPGGGVALARCVTALDKLKLEGDEQIGVNIVKRALHEPLRMIAENAGEEGAIVLGKIDDSKDPNYGYNALTGEYEDLVKAGVLDPTKVVRTALQNAGSIASLMLTTEALVAEIPEEKKGAPMRGGHGGGMEGMY